MQTIKYRFSDGTTSEIEVTDEFYTLYAELVQQEKRNHWKETRRHTSLEYLNENGIDFESPAADPLSVLLRSEDEERIHNAITALSDKQKDLAEKVFFQGYDINGNRKGKRCFATRNHSTTCNGSEKIKKFLEKNL